MKLQEISTPTKSPDLEGYKLANFWYFWCLYKKSKKSWPREKNLGADMVTGIWENRAQGKR